MTQKRATIIEAKVLIFHALVAHVSFWIWGVPIISTQLHSTGHSLESNLSTDAGIGTPPSRMGVMKNTEAPLKLRLTRFTLYCGYLPEFTSDAFHTLPSIGARASQETRQTRCLTLSTCERISSGHLSRGQHLQSTRACHWCRPLFLDLLHQPGNSLKPHMGDHAKRKRKHGVNF